MHKKSIFLAILSLSACIHVNSQTLSSAVQQGVDKGFKTCAPTMDRAVKLVNEDESKYAHLGTWNLGAPDSRVFNTLTIQPYSDGTSFASVTGVQNHAGECDTVLTQVFPVLRSSCTSLRETTFKGWKYLQDLGGVPLFEPPDDQSTTVILAPLGTGGCLIIKSAVLFEKRP